MIYPGIFEEKTGFVKIRELACNFCLFEPGKDDIRNQEFSSDFNVVIARLGQVNEFRAILTSSFVFPLENFIDISTSLKKARVEGSFLEEAEVFNLRKSISTVQAILKFLDSDEEGLYPRLKEISAGVRIFPAISDRVNMILNKQGKIKDNASKGLSEIRKQLSGMESSISRKLNQILQKSKQAGLVEEDAMLTIRDGRAVIPIASGFKRQIAGYVHDESATGKTAYIEPLEVVELNNELRELENAERRELIRILVEFTDFVRPYLEDLSSMHHFMAQIDSIRARAKFALQINAVLPQMKNTQIIDWQRSVHPLLLLTLREVGREKDLVPLDLKLDGKDRILLISGPNAGGKSVCLQTAGLLQYMLQCGFLVPMDERSICGIFKSIFLDMGDEQSIENDLSTYSSHLLNMKQFVKHADNESLVLIDEFGSGTEPIIGGAIAESVLESLNSSGCYGVMTTHYTNLKHFASSADGIINGAMLFDTGRLQPLFQLVTGRPGSSFAFEIAGKTGLPESILQKAKEKVGQDHIDFEKNLRELIRDKRYWENKRQKIRVSEKKLSELVEKYNVELQDTEKLRKKILTEAKAQAEHLLSEANRKIEGTIREIREAEAEKQKTREIRKKLEDFRTEIQEEQGNTNTPSSSFIDDFKEKLDEVGKHNQRLKKRTPVENRRPGKKPADEIIRKGDYVLLKGQETPGEVLDIRGARANVAFGDILTVVDIVALEKISKEKFQSKRKHRTSSPLSVQWSIGKKRLSFSPSIDVRGQRGDEALRMIAGFVDDAVMVQNRELTILHGKGNGILRELIREYLSGQNVVSSFRDEHVERGGSGITIVELDI